MEKIVILIGGAPTIGKTYLAKKIGKDLGLPWISTDTIRDQMRKTIEDRSKYPHLFNFERRDLPYMTSYLTSFSAKEIMDDANAENNEVWNGVLDFINDGSFGKKYIIEGIAILPEKVNELMKKIENVKPVFLIDDNKNRIRDVIYTRGLWDAAFKYPDRLKEKEVEWVVLFNEWIKSECKKYNFPVTQIDTEDQKYLDEVKKLFS